MVTPEEFHSILRGNNVVSGSTPIGDEMAKKHRPIPLTLPEEKSPLSKAQLNEYYEGQAALDEAPKKRRKK